MGNKKWTKEEDEILKKKYINNTVKQIQKQFLPHRTVDSIFARIKILRKDGFIIKNVLWTKEEDIFLQQFYRKFYVNDIARKIKRTSHAILGTKQMLEWIKYNFGLIPTQLMPTKASVLTKGNIYALYHTGRRALEIYQRLLELPLDQKLKRKWSKLDGI